MPISIAESVARRAEKKRGYAKKFRELHPERATLARKKWRQKNPERNHEYCRLYRLKNLEKFRSRQREYYKNNKDRVNELAKILRIKNASKYMYFSCKYRAKVKGIEFSIKHSDVVIPEFCPVFGLKLTPGTQKDHDSSPSVDRIDASLGYIPGNVRVISHRANRIKNDSTVEELEKIIKYMKGIK